MNESWPEFTNRKNFQGVIHLLSLLYFIVQPLDKITLAH
nr:MAG TPA: hypothetical protein [Caudoviricetes sp.]